MPAWSSRARDSVRRNSDVDTEGLEHVGAAALRGVAAVAVLGDPDTGRSDDEPGRGRDVEGADVSAAGSAGIHDRGAGRGAHGDHCLPEGLGRAGDLFERLALGAEAE